MKLSELAKRTGNDAPLVNLPLLISGQWHVTRWVVLGQADAIYGNLGGDLSLGFECERQAQPHFCAERTGERPQRRCGLPVLGHPS